MATLAIDRQIDFLSGSGIKSPISFWNDVLGDSYGSLSSSIGSDVDGVITFLSGQNVHISDKVLVVNFLVQHSNIISYLYELPNIILEHFGKTNMKLELFSEPDSLGETQVLFLEIETSLPPKEASDQLSKINRSWLLKIKEEDIRFFNISLKFL